jgi:formylmethanofuran dehydrogenase subunit B
LLGPWDAASLPTDVKALHPTLFHTPVESIGDVMAALRALMRGQPVQAFAIGGIPIQDLESLCAEFKAAHYLAIAWSAAEFDFPHADLAIQQIVECVRELNTTTRASALPLGGNRADMTLNQVCTWQSGTPVRTGFSRGIPHFDPLQGDYRKLLAEGEADVLLWYSALDPEAIPPETTAKLIVLGHPAMKLATKPAVFIPIGVPGIDHAGLFYRSDNVVSIPLKALRAPSNPPGSAILTAIGEALGTSPN